MSFPIPQPIIEQIQQNIIRWVVNPEARILGWFSGLKADAFKITGHITQTYNCIAWAAGDTGNWWEPENPATYWPDEAPNETTVDAYVKAFALLGYEVCGDASLERRYEKVAIYEKNGKPSHAARQCPNGRWTSKLGIWETIEHDFRALEGNGLQEYGQIVRLMRRRKPTLWSWLFVWLRSKLPSLQ